MKLKQQILALKATGLKGIEIAKRLGCSQSTVSYFCNGAYKQRAVSNHKKRREKAKKAAIDYKGGECIVCGYNKCSAALDFHHIDPTQNELGADAAITRKILNLEKLKPELDKCVLLCCRCHREHHAGYLDLAGVVDEI